ncbi:hypothetical protein ILUMI_13350 [Ignelater luminosus]|uniref:Uncharacterized protein n=1 Tax=Ignelater luminosus TaxID=2038154 RepID=A0A8K0CSK4_IGNLU|nr:hypothetical protein ILUMI_13350 [Ignelater luminosus]
MDANRVRQAIIDYFQGTYSERQAARVRSTSQSHASRILKKTNKEQHVQDDSRNDKDRLMTHLRNTEADIQKQCVDLLMLPYEYAKALPDYRISYEWHQTKQAKER